MSDQPQNNLSTASAMQGERIAKRIARAGLCSRRDAERWIQDGRVKVDGEVLTTAAFTVTESSQIEVDDKPLPKADEPRLFRFHKPTGYLTAARDPEGRKTITELMPTGLPRLMPIGRLDMNSEGLLLLTNDGELKRQLELPSTGWQRRYRVRVHGDIDEAKLERLKDGISIDGFDYGPIEAHLERTLGKNAWLSVALREGKNREIRRVMDHFGWPVNRLIRVSFGPFHLGNLARRDVDEIKAKVVKEQLGFILQSATPASERKRRLKQDRPKQPAMKGPSGDQTPASKAKQRNGPPKRQRSESGGQAVKASTPHEKEPIPRGESQDSPASPRLGKQKPRSAPKGAGTSGGRAGPRRSAARGRAKAP